MASINFATREINCKIVYYGPGVGGKTTNLQVIHQKLPNDKRSEMVSLATEQDRTLFFDFLPLDLGAIRGFKTRFQLYTVPGQVYYNSTRKLVLRGVDGVVFVADSQKSRHAENLESLQNLQDNLKEYGFDLKDVPFVLQYNKRDLPDIFTVEEMNQRLNYLGVDAFEAVAYKGVGVVSTLKAIARRVIEKFNQRQAAARPLAGARPAAAAPAPKPAAAAPAPAPKPAPAPAPKPAPAPAPAAAAGMDFRPPADDDLFPAAPAAAAPAQPVSRPAPIAAPAQKHKSSLADRNAFFFGGDDDPAPAAAEDVDEESVELRPYIPKKKAEAPSQEGG